MHIGFGSGGTAHAVSLHPVDEIRIVEISPAVLAASDRWFRDINHGVLADPRVRAEINDGRNFLLATPRAVRRRALRLDPPALRRQRLALQRGVLPPGRRRLAPGGVVSMWLPMYSLLPSNYAMILRAFANVFPHAAIWYEPSALNSFTVVTGSQAPAWSSAALTAAFADPRVAGELADIGIARPADLLPLLLVTERELQPWLATVPPHVDDLPAVEYESGALLYRDLPWLGTFTRLLALRPEEPPPEWLAALPPAEQASARLGWQARREVLDAQRRTLAAAVSHQLVGEPAGAAPSPVPPGGGGD